LQEVPERAPCSGQEQECHWLCVGQDLRQLWSVKGDKITPDDKNFKIFPEEGVLEWGFGPTYKAVVEDK